MAINFSKKEIEKAYRLGCGTLFPIKSGNIIKKFIRFLFLKFFKFKCELFNLKQTFKFKTEKKNPTKKKSFVIFFSGLSTVNENLEKNINDLQENGYTFINNFLNSEAHKNLNDDFPKFSTFHHTKDILKQFFICFKYNKLENNEIVNLKYYPTYKILFDYIFSDELENNFSQLVNTKTKAYSFLCSYRKEKSYLIPHMDGILKKSKNFHNFNFVYFIDGNNKFPKYSSGTGIFFDNEFKKPILQPSNLTNSCLIYKTSGSNKNFYHGFDTVKTFGFGKVVTFQFLSENFYNSLIN